MRQQDKMKKQDKMRQRDNASRGDEHAAMLFLSMGGLWSPFCKYEMCVVAPIITCVLASLASRSLTMRATMRAYSYAGSSVCRLAKV